VSDDRFEAVMQSICDGEPEVASELARKSLQEGLDPLEAINNGFMPGSITSWRASAAGMPFCPTLCMREKR
jgi:trimethylamine corrinoid protein